MYEMQMLFAVTIVSSYLYGDQTLKIYVHEIETKIGVVWLVLRDENRI